MEYHFNVDIQSLKLWRIVSMAASSVMGTNYKTAAQQARQAHAHMLILLNCLNIRATSQTGVSQVRMLYDWLRK